MIMRSHTLLEDYLNSRIIYNILDEQALYEYANLTDETIKRALSVFKMPRSLLLKPQTHARDTSVSHGRTRPNLRR